jgi:hypothetical protein
MPAAMQFRIFCQPVSCLEMRKLEHITVLPVVLLGYGICSVTLKEEYRLKLFVDRILLDYLEKVV